MRRRRFLFWISLGMFSLSDKLGIEALDRLAAATLEAAEDPPAPAKPAAPVHWRATHNSTWQWYEREHLRDGKWVLTGITTPIHRQTGEPYTGAKGYLDESLVPAEIRGWNSKGSESFDVVDDDAESSEHKPDPKRRARHGRPPSKWLRSLRAEELRIWLKTIDVPEAGVQGMTFWEHLTRDHFFDAEKINGLTIDEQAKLHAAAHHGY